jgi:anti-anti-sigma factor
MEITTTEHTLRIVVVQPHGRVDAFSAPKLQERFEQLQAEGVALFVCDLSEVPFIDSAGMALLVALLKQTREQGGDVKLVWPVQETARRVITLTRFDRVFAMAESAAAALKLF